jgi:hypothetical protein
MGWGYLKIFFSRTTVPILIRLGTDHPIHWQVCSNEGDDPSLRGDNCERVNIYWNLKKIFFSKTSRPNSIILNTNYPWVKGIQVCWNKGPGPFQRGDIITKMKKKMGCGYFKILFLRTMKPEKLNLIYMKAFWHGTKTRWLYHGPPRVKWKWNADYIFTWTKVTQVSDVAHGPLVHLYGDIERMCSVTF